VTHYIDNTKFETLIHQYISGERENEEELFKMFDLLIDKLISSFRFYDLDQEEAKQECFLLILKVLKNFNRDSGQAFNYFTTVILNNLRLLYSKNKKYRQKLESYRNHKLDLPRNPSSL